MAAGDCSNSFADRIGETAGRIWHLLDDEGGLSLTQLVKKAGEPRDAVMQALGWLAREGKVRVDEAGRRKTVSLCD